MSLPKPRAILFDWDNTLADTWPIICASLHKTFLDMGHEPWSEDEVRGGRDKIHHSLRESFPVIFGEDKWEEARDSYYKHFLECHLEKIILLPQAEATLQRLGDAAMTQAIVSNKTGQYLRDEVAHLALGHHFDAVIGAGDAERDKPYADPALLALEQLGLEPSPDIWLIGDSTTDVECALASGLTPIIFGSSHLLEKYANDARFDKPPHFVENHQALHQFLEV